MPRLDYTLPMAAIATFSLFFVSAPSVQADYTIMSTFDASSEAWVPVGDVTLTWSSTGGYSGGFLKGNDKATGEWWHYGAPAKFLGQKSAAYGRTLSFQLKQSDDTPQVSTMPHVIMGSDTQSLVFQLSEEPGTDWKAYTVPMMETAGWRITTVDGEAPTQAEFRSVLANLTKLHIRGEYSETRDTGGLDEVVLTLSGDRPIQVFPVASWFHTDSEGWRALGNTTGADHGLTWLATGGNPDGCVRASDNTSDTWYFVAPPSFTGNMSATFGRQIRFDLRQSDISSPFDGPDVILDGESMSLVHDTASNPGTNWTSYMVPLLPDSWRVDALTGALATEAEMRNVLSTLTGFRIRGEYRSGSDTAWLDNVIFGTGLAVYGDVDGNGVVDTADVIAALRIGAGLPAPMMSPTADVAPRPSDKPAGFGDGRVDVRDALRIMRFIGSLETVWP